MRTRPDYLWMGLGLSLAVIAALHQFKLPPVLPLMLADLGHGRTWGGSMMSIYALAGLVLSIPAGRLLTGRHGLIVVLAGLGCVLLGSIGGPPAAEDPVLFLVWRGLEGAGYACLGVAGPSLTTAWAGPRGQGIAAGLTATWVPIGQLIGAGGARLSIAADEWRLQWWLVMALSLLVLAALAVRLAASRRLSVLPGPGEVAHEIPSPGPPPGRPAVERGWLWPMLAATVLFCAWTFQYISLATWLPDYLVTDRQWQPATATWLYAVSVITVLPGNLIAGHVLNHVRRLGPVLAASLIVQMTFWLAALAVDIWRLDSPAGYFVALAVHGFAGGFTATGLFACPGLLGAPRGMGFGMMATGRNFGVLVGPVLVALIYEWSGRWAMPMVAVLASLAIALAASAVITVAGRRADGSPSAPAPALK